MGLLGSIVGGIGGGAVSLVGGMLAGKSLSKGYRQARDMYNQRMTDVKAHRDNLYYQDPTQSASSQAAVTQAQQLLSEQAKRTAASKAVTGGTDESAALQKAQGAAAVGQMMQQQAAQNDAKRETVWNNADQQIDAFNKYIADSKMSQAQAKAQAITQAASGLSNAATGILGQVLPF